MTITRKERKAILKMYEMKSSAAKKSIKDSLKEDMEKFSKDHNITPAKFLEDIDKYDIVEELPTAKNDDAFDKWLSDKEDEIKADIVEASKIPSSNDQPQDDQNKVELED